MTPYELETLLKEHFQLGITIDDTYQEYSDGSGSYKQFKVNVTLSGPEGEVVLTDSTSFDVGNQ
jgi:hypothetical protein